MLEKLLPQAASAAGRAHVALLAGWDEWSGNYLLATCEDGDAFLEQLHATLTG